MSERKYGSFEEFWPFYVSQHSKKPTRSIHFIGSTLALGAVAAAVVTRRPALLLGAPLAGYGAAWVSHFFVEKNRPATFTYPLWSLMGDARMWWNMVNGTMDAVADRVAESGVVTPAEPREPAATAAHAHAVN
jgi:hypothetical protein